MGRDPIHDDADSALVKIINQVTKIVWTTVARRWSIVVTHLVAPRGSVRMFFQRQELYVSETHIGYIVSQIVGHLAIRKGTVIFLYLPPPRAKVNFINRKRLSKVFPLLARLDPLRIAKRVVRFVDDRRRVWRDLSELCIRISL